MPELALGLVMISHFHSKFLKLCFFDRAVVEEVARGAVGDDLAVDDLERVGVILGDLPAGEVLAVEEAIPAVLVRLGGFFGSVATA